MSYNISLNFSSILAKLPGSRLLTLLRKGGHGFESPIDTLHPAATVDDELLASEISLAAVAAEIDKLTLTPGAWAFFASGYMLGLLLMTIVLHRMRNVIIPSRIPTRRARHPFHPHPDSVSPLNYTNIFRRLSSSILPLDLSRTTTRLALHLPSIYFLCKMLLIWCLLVLQTCQLLPSFGDAQKSACWGILGYVERLFVWHSKKEMGDICWATFCSVCAALLVEGLMKALDGVGGALPFGNVNSNTSPFNLVGYAFLLHAYSFPAAHSPESTNESPSRPDKHAIITITIPLLQFTIFHILSVSKRYSGHRLIPTALTSLFSLAHFHGTLFLHFFSSSPSPTPTPTNPLSKLKSTRYLGGSKLTYPFLNYVPNIFETILIGTILLTLSLNALVQLLVRGRVIRLFSGLGVGTATNWQDEDETTSPSFFGQLSYEEDFGILLLRVGTASLEATGLRGWSNEVAPIPLPVKSRNRNRARGNPQTYGVVRMGRIDVAEVRYGSSAHAVASTSRMESSSNSSNPYEDLSILRRRRTKFGETQQRQQRGLFNEVRTVDLGVTNTAEPSRALSGWWRQIKQSWSFFIALWNVLMGLVFLLWDKARSRKPSAIIRTSAEGHQRDEDDQSVEDDDDSAGDGEKEVYSRFLRGEEISDDEHDDDFTSSFEEEDSHRGIEDDDDVEEEAKEEEEEEENGQGEAVRLFSDFLRNGRGAPTTSAGSGEAVLAHLLHRLATSGPLTRQGWREFVGQGDAGDYRSHFRDHEDDVDNDDKWDRPSYNKNDATPADSQPTFNTAACVICTSGQRDIICWPCRCLAMCDDCREALASRSAPTKHCCPCCRQTVEGYSRIYIP